MVKQWTFHVQMSQFKHKKAEPKQLSLHSDPSIVYLKDN